MTEPLNSIAPILEPIPLYRCLEHHFANPGDGPEFPPGHANKAGQRISLFYSPDFVLEISTAPGHEPDEATTSSIAVDVTGKWRAFHLNGAHAERVLAAGLNRKQVLRGRQCAAVHLFNCPALVARLENEYYLFVRSSYVESLQGVVQSIKLKP